MKFYWVRAFLFRAGLLAATWWILLGHEPTAWLVGGPTVGLAALVSVWLLPPLTLKLSLVNLGLVLPKMLWRALAGGTDVAWRILMPSMRIAPTMLPYSLRSLQGDTARWCFLHSVSLLPGTLSTSLDGDDALIHVLANEDLALRELAKLEADISRVFPSNS